MQYGKTNRLSIIYERVSSQSNILINGNVFGYYSLAMQVYQHNRLSNKTVYFKKITMIKFANSLLLFGNLEILNLYYSV